MNSVAVSSTGSSAAEDLVPALVEHEVAEAKHVAGELAAGAPQDRLHARDDLRKAERLRHVVVAAGAERLDLVLDAALGGQEEDRGLEPALPKPAADLEAVDVGEHPVEHDQVWLEAHHRLERVASVRGFGDVEALVAERGRDGVDDRRLVVDDEDLGVGRDCQGAVHPGRILAASAVRFLRSRGCTL